KARVGDGIDQVADQELALLAQQVILAAEGHDARFTRLSGERGYAIRVEAGAGYDPIALAFAGGVCNAPTARITVDGGDARTGNDLAAARTDLLRQDFDDAGIIG